MKDRIIRKLSIGSDTQNQLHISVNGFIGGNTVSNLIKVKDGLYEVWMHGENDSIFLWKEIENMPVIVEHNTRID